MAEDNPHYHGHRQRLRERFLQSGLSGFAEHEVVELLLTLAIPRRDTKPLAKVLLARFGSLRGLLDASREDLTAVDGVGDVASVALHIIREAANYYLQQRVEAQLDLTKPESLYDFWRLRLGPLKHEVFEAAFLDSSGSLLKNGIERLEEGTVDRAAVYPRRVMEAAIQRKAATIIVAHNHPNRNVSPSEHDKVLTRALGLAAATLQLKLFDHLIVSADDVFSFRKEGLL